MSASLAKIGSSVAPFAMAFAMGTAMPAFGQEEQTLTEPATTEATLRTAHENIRLSPTLPWWLIGSLGGLSLAYGALAYRREEKTAIPYAISGMAASVLLANPVWDQNAYISVPNDVVLVIDQSPSQMIHNRPDVTLEIRDMILDQFAEMGNINPRILYYSPTGKAAENGTELFQALRQMPGLDPDNLGGVMLVTDGQITDVPEAAPYGEHIPFHTLITGQKDEYDRVTQLIHAPGFSKVGEEQTIRFRIDEYGRNEAAQTPVNISITYNGEPLETRTVLPQQNSEITLPIEQAGKNLIIIEAEPLEGELSQTNNTIIVPIDGIRETFNVLVLSGQIDRMNRPIRDFYKADPATNMIHISFMAWGSQDRNRETPRSELSTTRIPTRDIFGDSLPDFDLVVFTPYEDNRYLSSRLLGQIVPYVENGGAALMVTGPEFAGSRSLANSPLGNLFPVTPTGEVSETIFTPLITNNGLRHPVTRDLDEIGDGTTPEWGPWSRFTNSTAENGLILMEATDSNPLLILNDNIGEGKGRVAVLLSDTGLPLWQNDIQGGGPAQELLGRISHWLLKKPELEAEALRVFTMPNESLLIERQTLSEEPPPPVSITTPDDETVTLEFTQEYTSGIWQVEYPYEDDGIYHVSQEDNGQSFTQTILVGDDQTLEMSNIIATPTHIAPLIAETKGYVEHISFLPDGGVDLPDIRSIHPNENIPLSGEGWLGIVDHETERLTQSQEKPVINPLLGLLLFAGFAGLGWSAANNHSLARKTLGKFKNSSGKNDSTTPSIGEPNL